MFIETREDSRQFFVLVWNKMTAREPLEPLEAIVAGVIREHPEYQALLSAPERAMAAEYLPEDGHTNPFLHMGLHVALHEQLRSGRPQGIVELYRRMLQSPATDVHAAEHIFMECLAQTLWDAGRRGAMPDENAYLDCVRRQLP